ncbi:MAG: GNAT family N-acetyltransferase [Anaerolineales bacterium]
MVTYPIRRLSPSDAAALTTLSQAAGWNTTRAQWHRLLRWSGPGAYGIFHAYKGELLSSALSFLYEDQRAWLGGVLTLPQWQGQGLASRLMETVLQPLDRRGVPEIMLDATAQGLPLYERFGFRALYPMQRFTSAPGADVVLPVGPRRATPDDLTALVELDAQIFGAVRRRVIQELLAGEHSTVWLLDGAGVALHGAIIAERWPEMRARISGWWASDAAIAADLLACALGDLGGYTVLLDVPGPNRDAGQVCLAAGMQPGNATTRMLRGDGPPSGQVAAYYGAIGLGVG